MTMLRSGTKAMGVIACVGMTLSMTMVSLATPTPQANAVPSYSELAQSQAKHQSLKQKLSGVNSSLAQKIIELNDLTTNQIPAAQKAAAAASDAAESAQEEADAATARLEAAQKDKADLEQKIKETGEDYDDAHAAVAQLARDGFHGSAASDTMSMVTGSKDTDDFIKSMQSQAAVTRSESNAANDAANAQSTQMNRKQRLDAIEQQITELKTQAESNAADAQKAAADAKAKSESLNDLRNKGDQQRAYLESQQGQLKSATAKEAAQIVLMQSQIDSYNQQLAASRPTATQQINANSGAQGSTRPSSGSSSSGSSRPSSGGSSSGSHSSSGSSGGSRPSSGGSSSGGGTASGMNYSVPGNCPQGSSYCYGHQTGNVGNAYPWSQCTWWAYIRRGQLSLPVGSYLGNGQDWANSARALGYYVNNTPHIGAVMVFRAGQNGHSPIYGHVAVVERINSDGSVLVSEGGSIWQGNVHYDTLYDASAHQFVHY